MLRHGTAVLLPDGLGDPAAAAAALSVIEAIFNAHLDMNPRPMDDGNISISYNYPAVNIVLSDIAEANFAEIDRNHLRALASDEVLVTPAGWRAG